MKRCNKCKKIKLDSEFTIRSYGGLKAWCKDCCNEYSKQYYQDNKEVCLVKHQKYREKHKEHYRKIKEKYYQENRERFLEYQGTYRENNKDKISKYQKDWAEQNPEKSKAKYMLANAIKSGKIQKSSYCETCFRDGKLHGHHPDYNKPLTVVWLCPSCHKKIHTEVIDLFN